MSNDASLADVAAEVYSAIRDDFGRDATYRRGADSKAIRILPSRKKDLNTSAPDGFLNTPAGQTDWLLYAPDLTPEFGDPQQGDEIDITVRNVEQTWRIQTSSNASAWEYEDHAATWARVHTGRIHRTATLPAPETLELIAEVIA